MKLIARQRGYLLVTVTITLFLVASIAVLLAHDSANSANTSNKELEAARADYLAEAGMQHALWRAGNNACMGNVTIPATAMGSDSYQATISGAAAGTAYTLIADQDAWIQSDDVTRNNGTTISNHIRFETGTIEQALTRFDLSALPGNSQITSATAWFHIKALKPHPEGAITVHEVTSNWAEASVTWDSFATAYQIAPLGMIAAQDTGDTWVSFNITGQVQAWVNGRPNNGLLFDTKANGIDAEYTAREDGTNPPRLEVIVGSGPASPVNIQAVGTLANGNSRTLSQPIAAAYQPPVAYTFWPGPVDSADAEIWDQAPNNNYGDAAETWVSSASNDTTHSLLRFSTGMVPAGAKILEATLFLQRQSGSGVAQPVSAHRIVNPWDEDSVTWNSREAGTNWDTAGGDFDTVAVATTPVGPVNQRYEWDITPLVQGWVDVRYPNYGVVLIAAIDGMAGERFHTSDTAALNNRPGLSVTYACECGSACMAPQGSGDLLMVIGSNPGTPSVSDDFLRNLFESWGYAVTFIQGDASQGNFNAAVTSNDVVFVSESVASGNVGATLQTASIGVVNQRGSENDEFGLAAGMTSPVGKQITLTDTSHYITSIFAAGTLDIYDGSMELLTASGSEAPRQLADIGGAGALIAADTGTPLVSIGNAAGRRVLVPFGSVSGVNLTHLNNNGWLILQRSLAWAIGAGTTTSDPIILSTASGAILGGLTFDNIDLAEYDPAADSSTLFFEGALTSLKSDIDALHVLANGHMVLSIKGADTLGGLSFADGDLVDYDPNTDTATLYFDESLFSADEDVVSVFVMENGHVLLSTDSDARLGGLSFTDNDLIEYDPVSDSAILYFDGSATTLNSDISAVHVLANGHIILSTNDAATLGGLSFQDGDLVDYDPGIDTATLYFDEIQFSADENIISAHVGPGSGTLAQPTVPKKVLFVVGSVGGVGLTAEELAHQALIESWGHTVELIDDDATQGEFDTAASNNDVAFITNGITASRLSTKLVNASIGVVTSEDNLSDEFGLSSSIAWESGSAVEINDSTHYITSPFSPGILTFSSASESLAYLTGALSPDLGQLASSKSGYGIVTLETGATMYGGGLATGRRVQLPWGGSGFDPKNFNADGRTILQRALEWGAGAGADSVNRLLFVVTDAASPVADEIERQTLAESWGYIVTRISDADSQANFDAAASVNDLAYISGDALFGNVGIKLKAATIGVAFESYQLQDEFGLSAGAVALANMQSISIIDNSHYITSPYAGSVQITTSNTQLSSVSSYAPDTQLQLLASIPSYDGAIATFEAGDVDHYGDTVAGRRAKLPWGSTQWGFDVNSLSADGQDILKRSLEWVAGADLGGDSGGGGGDSDANFGFDKIFPSSQNRVRRKQISTQVTLAEDGTATSITAYVGGTDKDVRYAIYTDVAGEPGVLRAETANARSSTAMDWLTIDLPDTALTAGTYWLALSFDDRDQKYRYESGGQTRQNGNRATRDGYVANWGFSSARYNRKISIYATYAARN